MGWDSASSKIRALKVNASQGLIVDGSGVTQPVSVAGSVAVTGTLAFSNTTIAVTNAGTFATQSTLAAETTKVIGTVRALGNAGAIFDGATAATAPANAIQTGARGAAANPGAAVADGQLVGVMADKVGRLVVVHNHVRDMAANQLTTIASSSSETVIAPAISSTFVDITGIQITTSTATAHTVTIKDSVAGTSQKIYDIAANGGLVVKFDPPLKQTTVNTAWTATLSSAAVTTHINVDYVRNI
jgi:hypothetical protein